MGRRSHNHVVDQLCREWGRVRRQLLGVDDPKLAREHLGALRSTLGQRRDLHAGARSNKVEQHWPEVYEGEALAVNQAFHAMRPALKVIMDVHYATHATNQRRAEFLCMSTDTYLRRVNDARAFVEGWLARTSQPAIKTDVSESGFRRISLA